MISRPFVVAVENDAGERELLEMAMADVDLPVRFRIFESGEEALRFFEGHDEGGVDEIIVSGVALVLLDLNTPGLSGDQVVERLRANPSTSLIPVAILSGSARERDIRNAYSKGANAYLQKPVDFNQFSKLIVSTIEFWVGANRRLLC